MSSMLNRTAASVYTKLNAWYETPETDEFTRPPDGKRHTSEEILDWIAIRYAEDIEAAVLEQDMYRERP